MFKNRGFRFLEHTADVYIGAYGASLEEAFEKAALAMFEVMTDTETVRPKIEELVEVEGNDEQALLYSWLEDLLLKFDIDGKLYSKFKVKGIERTDGGYKLKAKVWGEQFNSDKHPSKTEIKAITYHRMEIRKKKDGMELRFILDV